MANRLYERFSMADKIALAATSEDLYIFVDSLKKYLQIILMQRVVF